MVPTLILTEVAHPLVVLVVVQAEKERTEQVTTHVVMEAVAVVAHHCLAATVFRVMY
jgi:hypothetical protein